MKNQSYYAKCYQITSFFLYYTRESHECHCQQTGGNQGDRSTPHAFRHFHQTHLLAQPRKENQSQSEAQSGGKGIHHAGQQVIVFLNHQNGYPQDTAVGRNQRKEYAQRLIQGGRHFLQDNLHHLYQGGDDQNERDGLQIPQSKSVQHEFLDQKGDNGGNRQHERNRRAHPHRRFYFLGNAQKRADSQELRQYDVVHKDCRDKNQYIFHNEFLIIELSITFRLFSGC